MCIQDRSSLANVALSIGTFLLASGAIAATPSAPTQAQIQELQRQVDELSQELSLLKGATGPQARAQAMQRHWGMMQDHMRFMRQMPGMSAVGCANWQMMDPSLMGPGMMGPGMMGPGCGGMMSHGMGMGMGSGMMGWAMPPSMTPSAYQQQMSKHMQTMRSQMVAISVETDPAKRDKLIRDHYDTMYRDMQTMRGMGWMWAPNAAASLPEAGSKGARLVSKYCSQCHAVPSPSIHTPKEWSEVTARMQKHIGDQVQPSTGSTVKIPSAEELAAITKYLGQHAAAPAP